MKNQLYSIGHGNRSAEVFTEILINYNIRYLVDVRTFPYSRYNTQFRRHELEYELGLKQISYVYLGHLLGGRPADHSCYKNERVSYDILKTKAFFLEGISRLKKAYAAEASVAIMCSESKPHECHRHHIIGRYLAEEGIFLTHIDEKGEVKETVNQDAKRTQDKR